MFRYFYMLLGLVLLNSCTNTYEENQKKAKKLYGECDNPIDNLKASNLEKYKSCKAKEAANGESFFDLTGDLTDIIGGKDNIVYQYSVNPYLWNASLKVTDSYPIKIADNQGGFIETDWITAPNDITKRCLIKIRILSRELITTGVDTSFLCENKNNDIWVSDKIEYIQEEKKITLRILEIAGNLANNPS